MAVTAQSLDAERPSRLGVLAPRSRPAPDRPAPSVATAGRNRAVGLLRGGPAHLTGRRGTAPSPARAEPPDAGRVRTLLAGNDIHGTCVKHHKTAFSYWSAFMVVLESELIRPSRCLGIEATALVMRSTTDQHE